MTAGDLVASILRKWIEKRDLGEEIDPADVIAANPEFADDLLRRFRALSILEGERQEGLPPLREGRYGDFRVAGEGGMGIVYWALDTDLNRQVAFKIVRPEVGAAKGTAPSIPIGLSPPSVGTPASRAFETLKTRFLQEAWVTAGLEHPGIVPVYELGQTIEGVPYYTMRFVRGRQTLATAIESAKEQPVEDRLSLLEPFLRVCDTMRYAHAHGVIHRDLKPENAAIGEFGEIVVLDWGLAKVRDKEDVAAEVWQERLKEYRAALDIRTSAGAMGTPGYMAPEAALGRAADLDERCDIYSLGAILFEILTGQLPFEFTTYPDLAMKLKHEAPRAALELEPTVPEELSRICATALAKDRQDRFAAVDELADAIRAWQRDSAAEREIRELLSKAEAAFEGTEGLEGEALLKQVDRVTSACSRVTEKSPGQPRAMRLVEACEKIFAQAIAQRERAAKGRILRRVVAAVVLLLAVVSVVVILIVNSERWQAVAAERKATEQRERAEFEKVAKERALEDVLRLADVKKVRDLAAEADTLWPVDPDHAGAMADWMERVRGILVSRAAHEATLARHQKRLSRPYATPADEWLHEVLTELVEGMAKLEDGDAALLKVVEARWALAAGLKIASIDDCRIEWDRAIAAIADEKASPVYGGLQIEPIPGLEPLGKDPDSGLYEFAHHGSGSIPRRNPDTGCLVHEQDSAIVLVLIPGGSFLMGAQSEDPSGPNYDPQADPRESPVHEVKLSPFLISKYECTQAQWAAMTEGGRPSLHRCGEVVGGREVTDRNPVEQVSCEDATLWLEHHRLRLPSEAEWEYACRAGTTTPWITGREVIDLGKVGNIGDAYCKANGGPSPWWYTEEVDDGHMVHAPVGSYLANAFGLFDMHANLFEWCEDWYGSYRDAPSDGSARTRQGDSSFHVCRGGSWIDVAGRCRSSFRISWIPGGRYLGFRPALSLR